MQEFVILDFNHLCEMDDHHEALVDMVLEAFGDKVADRKVVSAKSPVSEYWEHGYQVVVVYHKTEVTKMEKYDGLLWHGGYVRSPWPEASTADELREKLTTLSVEKRYPAAFFVLQGILTPDGELIMHQIMDAKGISIKTFAPGCNCHFVDWIMGDADGTLKLTRRGVEEEEEEGRANRSSGLRGEQQRGAGRDQFQPQGRLSFGFWRVQRCCEQVAAERFQWSCCLVEARRPRPRTGPPSTLPVSKRGGDKSKSKLKLKFDFESSDVSNRT